MNIIYKPSIFNFSHNCENRELLIYNSSVGIKSLLRVMPEKAELISALIRDCRESESHEVQTLIKHGFLMPENTNERIAVNLRTMEQVMNSSLHLVILPTEQCNFRCKLLRNFQQGENG